MICKYYALIVTILFLATCKTKSDNQPLLLSTNRDKLLIQKYLAENNIEAEEDEAGYFFQVLQAGNGAQVNNNDTVKVHYRGEVLYGDVFDDSRFRNSDLKVTVGVGQVIKGWDLALIQMQIGDKHRFYFPAALATGLSVMVLLYHLMPF